MEEAVMIRLKSKRNSTNSPFNLFGAIPHFSSFFALFIGLHCVTICSAQKDSVFSKGPMIYISGFVDVYYAFDFAQPDGNKRQPFLYNHNRHNEFNLNNGFLRIGIEDESYRANLAFHAGTYVADNYAQEPLLLRPIFEANVGIALNKRRNLWLDAGIFTSHIGFESAISIDNWTLTRSLLAENSPYYLSGAKMTWSPNKDWQISALVCNGWQRIQRLPGSSLPSFGTQVNYRKDDHLTLNWSTFIGPTGTDALRKMRYFNNFYGQIQLTERMGFIAGFDIGFEQRTKRSAEYDAWLSPVVVARYKLSSQWYAALRAEYFEDAEEIVLSADSPYDFKTTGLSLNFDYMPNAQIAARLEGRMFSSSDPYFRFLNGFSSQNVFIVGSLAIKFPKTTISKS